MGRALRRIGALAGGLQQGVMQGLQVGTNARLAEARIAEANSKLTYNNLLKTAFEDRLSRDREDRATKQGMLTSLKLDEAGVQRLGVPGTAVDEGPKEDGLVQLGGPTEDVPPPAPETYAPEPGADEAYGGDYYADGGQRRALRGFADGEQPIDPQSGFPYLTNEQAQAAPPQPDASQLPPLREPPGANQQRQKQLDDLFASGERRAKFFEEAAGMDWVAGKMNSSQFQQQLSGIRKMKSEGLFNALALAERGNILGAEEAFNEAGVRIKEGSLRAQETEFPSNYDPQLKVKRRVFTAEDERGQQVVIDPKQLATHVLGAAKVLAREEGEEGDAERGLKDRRTAEGTAEQRRETRRYNDERLGIQKETARALTERRDAETAAIASGTRWRAQQPPSSGGGRAPRASSAQPAGGLPKGFDEKLSQQVNKMKFNFPSAVAGVATNSNDSVDGMAPRLAKQLVTEWRQSLDPANYNAATDNPAEVAGNAQRFLAQVNERALANLQGTEQTVNGKKVRFTALPPAQRISLYNTERERLVRRFIDSKRSNAGGEE